MFRFEKLTVWHKAIDFADLVYTATRSFPADERFGLTSQMRRAAVSVSSNIAEGSGRISDKDNAHFLETAYGSLMEVVSQTEVALRQSFLPSEQRDCVYSSADEIARMLSGLRVALLQSERNPND